MFAIQISRGHSLLSKMLARGFINSLPHSFLWNPILYFHVCFARGYFIFCPVFVKCEDLFIYAPFGDTVTRGMEYRMIWNKIEIVIHTVLVVCDGLVMLGSVCGYQWSLITFYSASCCRENALFCKENYFSRNCGHYRNSVFIGYMLFSTKSVLIKELYSISITTLMDG